MNPDTKPVNMPVETEMPTPGGIMSGAPEPAAAPTPQIVTPSRRFRIPKFVFILLALVLLGIVAFAVLRFARPNFVGLGGKTELVWWGLWEDETLVQPLIDEYQEANPSVTIRYQKNDKEDYRERLMSSLARGEGPDIFRLHNSWIPMFGQELSPAPESIMSSQEFGSRFYPVAAQDLVGTRGPVALPLEYDGLAMFINEEIFTTYGAPIPTDWNDLRQIAKSLTIKDEKGVITQSGAALGTTSNVDHWPEIVALLMIQNGGDPNHPNDAAGRGGQALSFYKQFSAVDQVWDDTLPGSTVAFATGRVGIYFGPSWRALEIKDRNPSLKFRVLPVPQVPKADPQAPGLTYASYWAEGVWSKSEGASEAWKFLKFISERENLTKIYENASRSRLFGEPYPRPDMREMLLADPIVGGFLSLAPNATSGLLHSRTFDGASGINTSLTDYYEDAINAIDPTRDTGSEMKTLAAGVQQILVRYGLEAPPASPSQ